MSIFDGLFGKKQNEVIRRKDPTEFLKEVNVTAIKQEFKPAKSHKILIFEDCPTWAGVMKKALEEKDFEVKVSEDARNAVDDVAEFRPSLILMDVNLPGISGNEATKKIKNKAKFKDIPIIVVTSGSSPKNRMEAMMAGARTILTKDQPFEDIVASIVTYMENTAFKSNVGELLGNNPLNNK